MPEARNNFLKSRMNKDLEQRLVPPGEYRDAKNVMISRSEGDDVGALENVLGNNLLTDFKANDSISCCGQEIIGQYMDILNDRIFVFVTNFSDTSTDQLSDFAPTSALCGIYVYNTKTFATTTLVSGYFLNFSKTHTITGVNVIEQYFYWTDNRNQPRKINISNALSISSYYTTEDQISVSKYYPFESPLLIKEEVVGLTITNIGLGYSAGFYNLQPIGSALGTGLQLELTVGCLNVIPPFVGAIGCTGPFIPITNVGTGYTNGGSYYIVNDSQPQANWAIVTIHTEWMSTMYDRVNKLLPDSYSPNPLWDNEWDGDKNFLKDKFIRFAYRFKFDDGEYSLISPFTQECFVPEQDGYFVKTWNSTEELYEKDDEKKAYVSTEVNFMQNKINEIDIIFKSPYEDWKESISKMNIIEMDIIYKQSNEQSLRVVETIVFSDIQDIILQERNFEYKYKSEAPYKTLPQKDLLRIYDKVPVRAKTQEWGENRVIYGNFFDKPTPPDFIDYLVTALNKDGVEEANVKKEYQNHTLKQNRSYQVGIVLSDRYGRQSSVILARDDASTYFHPFKGGNNRNLGSNCEGTESGSQDNFSWYDINATEDNLLTHGALSPIDTWPGDSLNMTFISPITSTRNTTSGTPGLYVGYGVIDPDQIEWINTGAACVAASYNVETLAGQGSGVGMSLTTTVVAGEITAITFDSLGEGYMQGDIINIPCADGDASFKLLNLKNPNPLGWHSWKAVVKQTENDYYNVYTAGMLNGWIDGEGPNAGFAENKWYGATPQQPVAHFALYGDNISKIPRDLSLVGPTQALFRSGRPTVADNPNYYKFFNTGGGPFTVNPYELESETLLKQRDRELELDSGSQITNALINLSPRVLNSSVLGSNSDMRWGPGLPGAFANNTIRQWYPGESFSTVTTIGTGVELGLWDPSAKAPYNTAPVFYDWENNPLVAKLNIGSSLSARNCLNNNRGEANELLYFGKFGPSIEAGILRYNVGAMDVVGGATGDEYVPKSLNVGGKPVASSSTHPAPYNKTGEAGSGILFNITGVNNGGFTSNDDLSGPLIDRGISVANTEGENGVKGFISPDNSYPYSVKYLITGSGDGLGQVRLRITKEEWPGYMQPNIAILETQPLESKLDIYWETTTAGLLNELNTRIIEEDDYSPTMIRGYGGPGNSGIPLNYQQDEQGPFGVYTINIFGDTLVAYNGVNALDDATTGGPVTMSLKHVWSNGVDISSKFELAPTSTVPPYPPFTGGHYKLILASGFVYCTPPENNTFEFIINVQTPSPFYSADGSFLNTDINLGSYNLLNNQPYITDCPTNFSFSKSGSGPGPWPVVKVDGWNGAISGIPPFDLTNEELKCGIAWDSITLTDSGGTPVYGSGSTWSYEINTDYSNPTTDDLTIYFNDLLPVDIYTVSFNLTDAGGLSSTCSVDITVTV